jgi:hypothetical protein
MPRVTAVISSAVEVALYTLLCLTSSTPIHTVHSSSGTAQYFIHCTVLAHHMHYLHYVIADSTSTIYVYMYTTNLGHPAAEG